jgi:hypothetical protein
MNTQHTKRSWFWIGLCLLAVVQVPLDGCGCGSAEAAPVRGSYSRMSDTDGGLVITGPAGRVPSASECNMLCGETVAGCEIVQRAVSEPLTVLCRPDGGGRSC